MFQYRVMAVMTVVFIILYAPRIIGWFGCLRPQERLCADKKRRLALIVPARNEGKAVLGLFRSIAGQTYDSRFFHTYVIVKDPDDVVIGYARSIGADVYVDEAQTCKGDCLDYAIKSILKEHPKEYDGYIIVDADCLLDKDFLTEMNNAMESGASVINAKKLVANYVMGEGASNIVTSCNGLIWTIIDDLGNRFKSEHGLTTMTISTGILFDAGLIDEWRGWPYRQTLTEDMELQRDCGVMGRRTFFYSHAKIYMQEAISLTDTNKRRRRWMTGLIAADRLYFGRLVRRLIKRPIRWRDAKAFWDNYYLLCLWIVYAYIGGLVVIIVGNLAAAGYGMLCGFLLSEALLSYGVRDWIPIALESFLREFVHNPAFAAFGLIYLAFFVLSSVAVIADWDNIGLSFWKKIELMFIHPFFYMGYIRIVAGAFFGAAPKGWDEIERIDMMGSGDKD